MSGSIATYGFLPWMRQGISSKIKDATSSERAKLQFDVVFNGTTISKEIAIVGPGDILGFSDKVIVHKEPGYQVFNYEASNLAFIEFYDEDFPWRFTPKNVTNRKLTPWLALLMLKDEEFVFTPGDQSKNLPPKITTNTEILNYLHPENEHYAWAHVHVNKPAEGSTIALINDLTNNLPTHPDIAISRLLCSRKLEPNTAYTAFVVPAFETGRLSGIGSTIDLSTINSMKMSWDITSGDTPIDFPVYKSWRCGTGALGDFETLVRALKPTVLDPELGTRQMDISNSGMGLDGLPEDDFVGMEGALAPASFVPADAANNASTDDYTVALKEILNLADSMKQVAYTTSTAIDNPYVSSTSIQNDPIILPPIYGQWPADVNKIDSSSPLWLQELNLDPRYRAAAGLGAEIVRDRQDEFMEIAWKQIGEITAVNDKIAKARLAIEASNLIYSKHFIGAVSPSEDVEFNKIVKTGGLALKKVKFNTSSILSFPIPPAGIVITPLPTTLSASKASGVSNVTKAGIDSGFRKLTRPRGYGVVTVDKLSKAGPKVNEQLLSKMNDGGVSTANPITPSKNAISVNDYISTAPAVAGSAYTFLGMSTSTGGRTMWENIYKKQADSFKDSLTFLDKRDEEINPPPPAIIKNTFISTLKTKLYPKDAITERVKKLINLQVPTGSPFFSVKPIMAYPIIDEPMYDDLIKKSYEYLVPNLNKVPDNVVTLLSTNTKFIEGFMAGLNHEFSRELLWREYPTDQKGTYFKRFWDLNDTVDTGTADYLNDIKPMHLWSGSLGENHTSRHSGGGDKLVLLIRGDLLKKFPNTLIYAQKAKDYDTPTAPQPRELSEELDLSGDISTNVKFPIFSANLDPDIVMLGFDISKEEALGLTLADDPLKTNAGWYFVFRERPGQIRFGLDEGMPESVASWDDLSWGHMDSSGNIENVKTISIAKAGLNADVAFLNDEDVPLSGTLSTVEWGDNSATMAWILNQAPTIVSIHAEDMIG